MKVNLASQIINCIYAQKMQTDLKIYYECKNSERSHMRQTCNSYCSRCKARLPISYEVPAVTGYLPTRKQMTMDEWLRQDEREE